jgi:8-oxo-dGTP pyrophosphatase MutT (NUDIX family)
MDWYKTSEKDKKVNGSGILYLCENDSTVLLLLRSKDVKCPKLWALPGGHVEDGEGVREAAERETVEEMGSFYPGKDAGETTINFNGDVYMTYIISVDESSKEEMNNSIQLNWEHDKFEWFGLDDLPENMFEGAAMSVAFVKNDILGG